MKNIRLIFVALICLLLILTGCNIFNGSELPSRLNSAKRPLVLRAKGSSGILIEDANGNLYSYKKGYYFAQVVISSTLMPGDIIAGE